LIALRQCSVRLRNCGPLAGSRSRSFVSAALYEPFGLAVLEEAAAGLPAIMSYISTSGALGRRRHLRSARDELVFHRRDQQARRRDDFQRSLMGRQPLGTA
jgi:hypothetical protein